MKRKGKKLLIALLSLCMVMTMAPLGSWAADGENGEPAVNVARIASDGGTVSEYKTLDEAVEAAEDGATIELLADCTTEGLNLSKSIMIQRAAGLDENPTVTFEKHGIALWGKDLTFKDCNVIMNGIGSTPYTAEWNWMSVCASPSASLSLENVSLTMDGTDAGNAHAIYFCSDNKLNVRNSTLVIRNYEQDALEWDGGDGGYNVNIENSTFLSDTNRSGFTGTFIAAIDNSSVDVVNSTGNGSNGSHFEIKNQSKVNFSDNKSHGLSTGRLTIDNSSVAADRNGGNGIHTNSTLTIRNNSSVEVKNNRCSISSQWTVPAAIHVTAGERSLIDGTSTVTAVSNSGSGLLLKSGNLTVEDGADIVIKNNRAEKLGYGGGINVRGTLVLPTNAVLYNNHADSAGDDIYSADSGSITFGEVDANWELDGAPDCEHAIDGWYDDSENQRWEAHKSPVHVEKFDSFNADGLVQVTGEKALKAAHSLVPADPDDPDAQNWQVSKSKTAENLVKQSDGTYTSEVTLSLPAAEEELISDVVFVLDESSCSAPVKESVSDMLEKLYGQIENTGATIKIGAVQFRGEVTELPLTPLTENTKDVVTEFMSARPETGGSNMHAGLTAAQKMLEADTAVADNRKYVILVSDGITYIWDEEGVNKGVNFANADAPDRPMLASPDGWDVKYGNGYVPEDWNSHFSTVEDQLNATIAERSSVYDCSNPTENKPFVKYSEKDGYSSTVDIALYKSQEVYQELAEKYHAYAVCSGVENEMKTYPFGPSFMNYLAGGTAEVDFSSIQKEIYYLLDEGSSVTDYMGYTAGDDGYNFDFEDSADSLKLRVGDDILTAETLEAAGEEDSRYGFGPSEEGENVTYDYILLYYKGDGQSTEHFVWEINVPVSNFAPVQLTYTVRLMNPKTASGTYGVYDKDGIGDDGKQAEGGLYTNNSAVLYPVDSNGGQGVPENFYKPTVSYTISSGGGGGGGTTPSKPELEKEDHFAYIIGYPQDYQTGEATSDKSRWPVRPEDQIDREEVATIFFRLLTDDSRAEIWAKTNRYTDVSSGKWSNNAISTMSAGNIVNGYPDGTFGPDKPITRAEFAAIAARFDSSEYSGENKFSDVSGHWAAEYINRAAEKGWITGYPDGTFRPDQYITRAEAMTLVNRVLNRRTHAEDMLEDMIKWPDNPEDAWYYEAVQEATNGHKYEKRENPDTEYEKWTEIEDVRDWSALEKEWSEAAVRAAGERGKIETE